MCSLTHARTRNTCLVRTRARCGANVCQRNQLEEALLQLHKFTFRAIVVVVVHNVAI